MSHEQLPISPAQPGDLCVSRVPLFQGLSHEQQAEVAQVARPTRLARGEQVYGAGSEVSQLMVVHTGTVKLSRVDVDGREQVLRVLGPGDFIGESALLTGRRPDHFASALEQGSMCVFRHADLERLVDQHPSIGWRMLRTVSDRLQDTEGRLASLISGDVTSRLAAYLLTLEAQHGPEGLAVELPMAKKDVASLLDTTPESLSRQLRRLNDSGVVTTQRGRWLLVPDVDALMELAGHG